MKIKTFVCSGCLKTFHMKRRESLHNFCSTKCYHNFRTGKPRGKNLEQRLWDKVIKQDGGGCWNWTGATCFDGYGTIGEFGKTLGTHRVAFQLTYGKIPHGLNVCHHCDNRRCVRPDHLFLGTQKDNMADCSRKNRIFDRNGMRNPNVKLSGSQVYEIRKIFDCGEMTRATLAKRFGVKWSAIDRIVRRIHWKNFDPQITTLQSIL